MHSIMICYQVTAGLAAIITRGRDQFIVDSAQRSLRLKFAILASQVFFILWISAFENAGAVQPLSSAELESHCAHYRMDPGGKDGIFCVRYIQGFIDGAVATDERVTLNVSDEYEKEESFSERAIRIRLGNRIESYGSSYYAEFCLGTPVPLAEVVQNVATALKQPEFITKHSNARDIVYRILRENYPCEPGEK